MPKAINRELAEQIKVLFAQNPELLIMALVQFVLQRRIATQRRQRARESLAADIFQETTFDELHGSRAKTLCALATGSDRERLRDVAVDVVRVLQEEPGLSLRQLRNAVREARGQCADGDVDAAVVYLGAGIRRDAGPRSAWLHTIDLQMLPDDVREQLGSQYEYETDPPCETFR